MSPCEEPYEQARRSLFYLICIDASHALLSSHLPDVVVCLFTVSITVACHCIHGLAGV